MKTDSIVVAFGGVSPEHEVSVLTAMQAISALKDKGHQIRPLYISKSGQWYTGQPLLELESYEDLDQLTAQATPCTFSHDDMGYPVLLETESRWFSKPQRHRIRAVIVAFHGSEGENGSFQGTCEMYNIPYTGSGVFASSIGMNKVKAKQLCAQHHIPVVDGVHFVESEWVAQREQFVEDIESIGYPVIIKPVTLGSSIGVQRAESSDELVESVEESFRYDDHLMVEQAIVPLKEINCSVLGTATDHETSVCERPLGKEELLSFEDKYQSDGGEGSKGMASQDRIIPADIPEEQTQHIQQMASQVFSVLDASGLARLDFLVNANTGKVYFNEINTIPGSFSFYLWEESEYDMAELMQKLIAIAEKQHQKKNGRVRSYDTNLLSQKAVQGIKGLKGPKSEES